MSEIYRGHRIEIPEIQALARGDRGPGAPKSTMRIDGTAMSFGRLPEGKYYFDDYAYDWQDNPADLARRYIDHLEDSKKN